MAVFNNIGIVKKKMDGTGSTIRLGNPVRDGQSASKYNYHVELIVRDLNGNVIAQKTNPNLVVKDPREQTDKEGNQRNIPDWLLKEILIVTE